MSRSVSITGLKGSHISDNERNMIDGIKMFGQTVPTT
jgi:hypothetical protein